MHLIMKLSFNAVDLGDISDLSVIEQKQLRRSINDFLGLSVPTA
ncbi:hypothetical protein BN59_00670 [Legionella massiliensis]|uniref:Uncharacterized protein n=1 Tax=Legionella massiliensis TaxID=1034943 RepID=A0A078KTL7_9GAMM|nr:hypothetical protein BN59_00670 [Legionella massiliensis]CEE12139.1 hypothetical protein BN1094_00670 [Legionella massiliensis]